MPDYRVVTDQKDADTIVTDGADWKVRDGLLFLTDKSGALVGLWNVDHLVAVIRQP